MNEYRIDELISFYGGLLKRYYHLAESKEAATAYAEANKEPETIAIEVMKVKKL